MPEPKSPEAAVRGGLSSTPMAMVPRAVLVSPEFRSLRFAEVKVLLLLDSYARGDTGRAWPLQARLAEEADLTVDTVSKAILRLEGAGFVRREAFPGNARRSLYVVLAPPSCREP